MKRPTTVGIIIHHTAGHEQSAETLRNIFKSRFGVDYIGYHRCISQTGEVWGDLDWDDVGIHNNAGAVNNYNSVGIALVGNFNEEEPRTIQLQVLETLLSQLLERYPWLTRDNIYGHRDFKATSCPGENLYKLKPWIGVTMTDEQKHRESLEWAFRSIYRKEPTKAKIDFLAEKYSDINEARKAMLDEVFEALPKEKTEPCVCPPVPVCPSPESQGYVKKDACASLREIEICNDKVAKKLFWNIFWIK